MPLSIKNEEAAQLAREVADLSGNSITRGVIVALKARRDELLRQQGALRRLRLARACLEQEVWHLPNVDTSTSEEDLLDYGKSGACE